MGRDGAAGATAVKAARGVVIAQSPDTAEYDSMPRAAATAAHLVLSLVEISAVLAGVVDRRPLPHARTIPLRRLNQASTPYLG
jgi:two-component system chemotaxis response regulator CheB